MIDALRCHYSIIMVCMGSYKLETTHLAKTTIRSSHSRGRNESPHRGVSGRNRIDAGPVHVTVPRVEIFWPQCSLKALAGSARREGSDLPKKFKARSDDCASGWTLRSLADSKFEPPDVSCSASLPAPMAGYVAFISLYSARLAKTEKRDPRRGVEATSIRCPRIPIARRTMKRPMPRLSRRAGPRRVKAWNIRGSWSSANRFRCHTRQYGRSGRCDGNRGGGGHRAACT
jgi:hypothetical protein